MAIFRSPKWPEPKYKKGDKVIIMTNGYVGASADPDLPNVGIIDKKGSLGPTWYYSVWCPLLKKWMWDVNESYLRPYAPTNNAEASVSLQKEY